MRKLFDFPSRGASDVVSYVDVIAEQSLSKLKHAFVIAAGRNYYAFFFRACRSFILVQLSRFVVPSKVRTVHGAQLSIPFYVLLFFVFSARARGRGRLHGSVTLDLHVFRFCVYASPHFKFQEQHTQHPRSFPGLVHSSCESYSTSTTISA